MKKTRAGFTLVELLLAITIFAIVAIALYSSFHAGVRILRRSEEVMEFHQGVRRVLDEVELDLHNTLLAELPSEEGDLLVQDELSEEEEKAIYFKGDAKSFNFIALKDVFTDSGLESQVCNIKYYLSGAEGGTFSRDIDAGGSRDEEGVSGTEAMLSNVSDVEISYSYEPRDEDSPPEWLGYWDEEEKVPLGVKITFRLRGLGSVGSITKTVFIDIGALGVETKADTLPIVPTAEVGL